MSSTKYPRLFEGMSGSSCRISFTSSSTLVLVKPKLLLSQVQQIDRLRFWLAIVPLVFENNSRRVVPEEELFEFHFKVSL